jgi:hypothetical protein
MVITEIIIIIIIIIIKGKVVPVLIKHYAMKAYGGADV